VLSAYREVVMADAEYAISAGERPRPLCFVAHELRSGRRFRIWQNEFGPMPPWTQGPDVLFISYYSPAELNCFRVLGWSMPQRLVDLYCEFRAQTNGRPLPSNNSLLGALAYYGLDGIGAGEKHELQVAIGSDTWEGRFTKDEILTYCEGDVVALERLIPAMAPRINLGQALLRGRYMAAVSAMEHAGVPIDVERLSLLRESWAGIKDALVAAVDADFNVYVDGSFKVDRFVHWLAVNKIPWPRHESGALALDDETFRQMAKIRPVVAPLRELRHTLSKLRLNDLAVGQDGRNRVMLSPFRAKTGRNQPSNSRSIFGPSCWLRSLIKPPPGYGLAYIDWKAAEFGIGAALSGDTVMQEAYRSGDPYLSFAKQAGLIPRDASRETHGHQRELFKTCLLGTGFGMGPKALALRIDQPEVVGRDFLQAHRRTYPQYWKWSDAAVDYAMLHGKIWTRYGWYLHISDAPNPRSIRNFPLQAGCNEVLRLACSLATEAGLGIAAPVHDALVLVTPMDRLDADIERTRTAMAEASKAVLAGFELATDVKVVRYPDRYMDPRGVVMWARVMDLIGAEPISERWTA
jgi:DNA polymerase I